MGNLTGETKEVSVPVLEITNYEDMQQIVGILTNNSYEVQVTPVYETQEGLESRGVRLYRGQTPRVKYCLVKILGFIEKPEYKYERSAY